jgi:hypothetical protein
MSADMEWETARSTRRVTLTLAQWALLQSVVIRAAEADAEEAANRRKTGIGDVAYREDRAARINDLYRALREVSRG